MLVEVALPLPIPRTFTYRVEREVEPGTRVLVPFGRRKLIGWVDGPTRADGDAKRIRPVTDVLEDEPSAPADLLALCRWIADYYLAPLGLVLRAALPAVLSRPARPEPPVRTTRVLTLVKELPSLTARSELFGRAHRQRECYEYLEERGGSAEVPHLADRLGFSYSVLDGLVDKGLARFHEERVERDPFADAPVEDAEPPPLTPAQATIVERLVALTAEQSPLPVLLRGVTGSGKTRVYIELLDHVVNRLGRGAIVLVPEIALTPQTVARFRSRFGDQVAVLHSGLSDGERYDAWRALHRGERRVAIGARSAVFAPVRDLGAIVVDEEHEGSYKQSEAPRYHAREVAVMRCAAAGAVCLLGSATPALESWHNARRGKFELQELPDRIGGWPLPSVQVVDLRGRGDGRTGRGDGAGDGSDGRGGRGGGRAAVAPILSPPLLAAMRDRLERGEQTILLLNRRGYSTFVQCRSCGAVWHCPDCNVSLTYHRGRRRLVCHYCLHEERPPERCDECGAEVVAFRGVGTEQVERTVLDALPGARVARMDVDTTSGKWAHHEILGRVGRSEIDVLLGTQMIAKGLDFPGVTLVGVVNADVGLNLPDFRASERTFQLLTQVAGRAGRASPGEVLIQTAAPGHYAVERAVLHDYLGFSERELEERRGPCYPPHCRLINVVLSGTDEKAVHDAALAAADWTLSRIARDAPAVSLLGPAPCPIDRIRGRWRWHFLLRSPSAAALGVVGSALLTGYTVSGAADLRLILDRDPVTLL